MREFAIESGWQLLPEMNEARYLHSSCCAGSKICVIGGLSEHIGLFLDLEILDLRQLHDFGKANNGNYKWQKIACEEEIKYDFSFLPLIASLGESKLVILGPRDDSKKICEFDLQWLGSSQKTINFK